MEHFDDWCRAVLQQVRFWPDCDAIRKELTNHYEDHVKDLQRIGYDEALAKTRALAAMGDAEEVGRGLDEAHKPWLGWLWEMSRYGVVLVACFMLLFIGAYNLPQIQEWTDPAPYFPLRESDETVSCPRDFSAGIYSYEFEHAQYGWNGQWGTLDICLTAETPRFWLGGPVLYGGTLEAVDSSGNLYTEGNGRISGSVRDGHYRTACLIRLNLVGEIPEWIEVTNTAAEWSFRIYLKEEGGTA